MYLLVHEGDLRLEDKHIKLLDGNVPQLARLNISNDHRHSDQNEIGDGSVNVLINFRLLAHLSIGMQLSEHSTNSYQRQRTEDHL